MNTAFRADKRYMRRRQIMKFHKATLLIMALALCLFSSTVPALSAAQAAPQTLNAEPIEGKLGCYHVAIRFREIESVSVLTLPEAESRGTKHESYELEKNEWEYDPVKSLLEIKRKIDPSLHIIRAKGKYQTPLRIIPSGPWIQAAYAWSSREESVCPERTTAAMTGPGR
jgi:hypothetical protein